MIKYIAIVGLIIAGSILFINKDKMFSKAPGAGEAVSEVLSASAASGKAVKCIPNGSESDWSCVYCSSVGYSIRDASGGTQCPGYDTGNGGTGKDKCGKISDGKHSVQDLNNLNSQLLILKNEIQVMPVALPKGKCPVALTREQEAGYEKLRKSVDKLEKEKENEKKKFCTIQQVNERDRLNSETEKIRQENEKIAADIEKLKKLLAEQKAEIKKLNIQKQIDKDTKDKKMTQEELERHKKAMSLLTACVEQTIIY